MSVTARGKRTNPEDFDVPFTVRDYWSEPIVWISNALVRDPHLNDVDIRVYCLISMYKGQPGTVNFDEVGKRCGLSEQDIQCSIEKLNLLGCIKILAQLGQEKRISVYDVPKGCIKCQSQMNDERGRNGRK